MDQGDAAGERGAADRLWVGVDDEPGLDGAGLEAGGRHRGGTVLLSSHLLAEVEAVADQLVIIGGGRIAAAGSREELLAGTGTLVRATDADALAAAMEAAGLSASAVDGGFVVDADPETVGRAALDGRVVLSHLGPSEGAGLEQLFFDLTTQEAIA